MGGGGAWWNQGFWVCAGSTVGWGGTREVRGGRRIQRVSGGLRIQWSGVGPGSRVLGSCVIQSSGWLRVHWVFSSARCSVCLHFMWVRVELGVESPLQFCPGKRGTQGRPSTWYFCRCSTMLRSLVVFSFVPRGSRNSASEQCLLWTDPPGSLPCWEIEDRLT